MRNSFVNTSSLPPGSKNKIIENNKINSVEQPIKLDLNLWQYHRNKKMFLVS